MGRNTQGASELEISQETDLDIAIDCAVVVGQGTELSTEVFKLC